ncbi:MAG: hypothetical protein WAK26_03180, partial [Terracidiphilus sp.]
AKAQYVRGSILMGFAPMQESVAATQEAIDTFNQLLALPGVSSDDLMAAACAWTVLGDELGASSKNSMYDLTAALRAYAQMKTLLDRALILDHKSLKRSSYVLAYHSSYVVAYHGRIAQLDGFTDPDQELEDAREGLQEIAALPFEELQSLYCMRFRMWMLTLQNDALTQLGRYTEAHTLANNALGEVSSLAAADPQDQRAEFDLVDGLDHLAAIYEAAADPELEPSADAQRRNLTAAEPVLLRENAVLKRMQQSSSQQYLRLSMADAQVRLGIVQYRLRKDPSAAGLVRSGLSDLEQICARNQNSAGVLNKEAKDLLQAEPASVRNPKLALGYAARAVEFSHHKVPDMLLTLARAYRAKGQIDLSRATAREGLALLPQPPPHAAPTNMRRLLEKQTR